MGLTDYISRHSVKKPQPLAFWDEHFVVSAIDDFVSCLEFQDSTVANVEIKKNGFLGRLQLDRNENFANSNSRSTKTEFSVKSPLIENNQKNSSLHCITLPSNNQSLYQTKPFISKSRSLQFLYLYNQRKSEKHIRYEPTITNRNRAPIIPKSLTKMPQRPTNNTNKTAHKFRVFQ